MDAGSFVLIMVVIFSYYFITSGKYEDFLGEEAEREE
jgi:hypothetical protein